MCAKSYPPCRMGILVYKTGKCFKGTQRHRSILDINVRIVRYQDPVLSFLQFNVLGKRPGHGFLSEIRHHDNLLIPKGAGVGKHIVVLRIEKLKVAIYEDVLASLPQAQNRCPVLENTIFYPDLGFCVDLGVALVLLLPRLSCGKTGIFRVAPLD